MDLLDRTVEDWQRILAECGVRPSIAVRWAPTFNEQLRGDAFSAGEEELDDFLGQVLHESGLLTATVENLNYSAEALMRVWPHRFDEARAQACAHNQLAIAQAVYDGRMGNTKPGDGYCYRGRGLIQITGHDGYEAAGAALGVDLLADPDKLAEPDMALRSAIAWWEGHIPDSCLNDCVKVTKRVNGGTEGIAHRKQLTEAAWRALNA